MAGQQRGSQNRGGGNFQLGDYVDVPTRMVEFRTKHPEGCLQPADPAQPYKLERVGDYVFVVYVAAAYRTPDDPRPGIGVAWEPFPGKTPYTRDSELMNAETSAWGRAIMAALAADAKKGIASAEEVRNRQAERDQPQSGSPRNRDGSLSRSQMSDEELAAAGTMTRQQMKEHNALAKEVQGEGGTERAKGTPADDAFYTSPPEPDGKLAQALEDKLNQVGTPEELEAISQEIVVARTQGKLSEEWLERLQELYRQTAKGLRALAGDAA